MLKRVVVLGESARLIESLAKGMEGRNVQPVSFVPGSDLPPGTVAALAGLQDAAAVADLAVVLGGRVETLIRLIADAIDCREGFAEGSAMRVLDHATRFALALGLNDDEQLTLERGALVRDVGKIRINNEVLLKAGVLNYDEWCLLQQHPHLGAEIVVQSEVLKDTAEIVRNHHESFDGYGYPDGLEGEAIPRLARVMKIIDVYCAMTSPRHYRPGHSSQEDAFEYIRSEKGKHFDPELVDVFLGSGVAGNGN